MRPFFLVLLVGWLVACLPAKANPTITLCFERQEVLPWRTLDGHGLDFELLDEAARRIGVTFDYRSMPWKRCLEQVKANELDGLFAASFSSERLAIGAYPGGRQADTARRLHTDSYILVRRKGSAIDWDGKQFRHVDGRVGFQLGYSVGEFLRSKQIPVDEGSQQADELVQKLMAGRLVGKIDSRLLVGIGVVLMGVSLYMMTGFAIDQPSGPVIRSGVVQGLGLGLIFVPLQSLAFETLAPRMRTTAAALLNLSRNIGGSVGISVVSTQLVRMTQVAHADLAHNITEQTIPTLDPTVLQTIFPVAGQAALAYINMEVTRQALFIAYLDDFKLMMIVTFAVLPLLLFMRRGNKVGTGGSQHVAMD